MKFGKLAACIAATSLVAAPALAQSQQSAAKPAAAKIERVSAKSDNASKVEGESGLLIGLLATAAVVGGFFAIAESSSPPASP